MLPLDDARPGGFAVGDIPSRELVVGDLFEPADVAFIFQHTDSDVVTLHLVIALLSPDRAMVMGAVNAFDQQLMCDLMVVMLMDTLMIDGHLLIVQVLERVAKMQLSGDIAPSRGCGQSVASVACCSRTSTLRQKAGEVRRAPLASARPPTLDRRQALAAGNNLGALAIDVHVKRVSITP